MVANTAQAGYEFGLACDVGRKRRGQPNQDAAEIVLADAAHPHPPLLLVADGLGGHRGGATASQTVIEVFKRLIRQDSRPDDYRALLEASAREAHTAIRTQGAQNSALADMGSTVVAAVIDGENLHILNVGDSRAYLARSNRLIQLSQDQSWVAEQVRAGLLKPQEAVHHPRLNRLSMAITAKRPEIKTIFTTARLEPDDIILLCSDGLWGVVPESLIWAAATELSPQQAADKLVAQANSSRGPDNISVIIARRQDRKPRADISMEDTNPGE